MGADGGELGYGGKVTGGNEGKKKKKVRGFARIWEIQDLK